MFNVDRQIRLHSYQRFSFCVYHQPWANTRKWSHGIFWRRIVIYERADRGSVKAALCKLENDPGLADRTNLTPTQIADLLNFVLRSTYFQYNGSIYE